MPSWPAASRPKQRAARSRSTSAGVRSAGADAGDLCRACHRVRRLVGAAFGVPGLPGLARAPAGQPAVRGDGAGVGASRRQPERTGQAGDLDRSGLHHGADLGHGLSARRPPAEHATARHPRAGVGAAGRQLDRGARRPARRPRWRGCSRGRRRHRADRGRLAPSRRRGPARSGRSCDRARCDHLDRRCRAPARRGAAGSGRHPPRRSDRIRWRPSRAPARAIGRSRGPGPGRPHRRRQALPPARDRAARGHRCHSLPPADLPGCGPSTRAGDRGCGHSCGRRRRTTSSRPPGSRTRAGVERSTALPSPRRPNCPAPQQNASPLVRVAQAWLSPALSEVTASSTARGPGSARQLRLPAPSWPWRSSPQQSSDPSRPSAQVTSPPASRSSTSRTPAAGTGVGIADGGAVTQLPEAVFAPAEDALLRSQHAAVLGAGAHLAGGPRQAHGGWVKPGAARWSRPAVRPGSRPSRRAIRRSGARRCGPPRPPAPPPRSGQRAAAGGCGRSCRPAPAGPARPRPSRRRRRRACARRRGRCPRRSARPRTGRPQRGGRSVGAVAPPQLSFGARAPADDAFRGAGAGEVPAQRQLDRAGEAGDRRRQPPRPLARRPAELPRLPAPQQATRPASARIAQVWASPRPSATTGPNPTRAVGRARGLLVPSPICPSRCGPSRRWSRRAGAGRRVARRPGPRRTGVCPQAAGTTHCPARVPVLVGEGPVPAAERAGCVGEAAGPRRLAEAALVLGHTLTVLLAAKPAARQAAGGQIGQQQEEQEAAARAHLQKRPPRRHAGAGPCRPAQPPAARPRRQPEAAPRRGRPPPAMPVAGDRSPLVGAPVQEGLPVLPVGESARRSAGRSRRPGSARRPRPALRPPGLGTRRARPGRPARSAPRAGAAGRARVPAGAAPRS